MVKDSGLKGVRGCTAAGWSLFKAPPSVSWVQLDCVCTRVLTWGLQCLVLRECGLLSTLYRLWE